jgi:hypothetical protein
MTCLFIEPDNLHRSVVKSWITTNMMPKETGPIEGKRDLTSASELLELSIPFTGISQYGLGVNKLAQAILDSINITYAVPYLHKTFMETTDAATTDAATTDAAGDGVKGVDARVATMTGYAYSNSADATEGYLSSVNEYVAAAGNRRLVDTVDTDDRTGGVANNVYATGNLTAAKNVVKKI